MGKRFSEARARTVLALVGVCVAIAVILLAEVGARHFIPLPQPSGVKTGPGFLGETTHFDSELGWFNDLTPPGEFRQSESCTTALPPDSPLVLVLGDSTTWGLCVEANQTFVSHLCRTFPNVRFINGGVNAYGTVQEYLLLRRVAEEIRPTHLLLVFSGNDFHNNHNPMEGFAPYVSGRDGEYVIANSPVSSSLWGRLVEALSSKSHIMRLLRLKNEKARIEKVKESYIDSGSHGADPLEATKYILSLVRNFTEEQGIRLLVLLQPSLLQLDSVLLNSSGAQGADNDARLYAEYASMDYDEYKLQIGHHCCPSNASCCIIREDMGVSPSPRHTQQMTVPFYQDLVEYGGEAGFPMTDLTDEFRREYVTSHSGGGDGQDFFCDISHLNPRGHEAIAGVMAGAIGESAFLETNPRD